MPAANLEACKTMCTQTAGCNGLDWNPANPANLPCWLSGPWSGRKNVGFSPNITHYNRIGNCEGKQFNLSSLIFHSIQAVV